MACSFTWSDAVRACVFFWGGGGGGKDGEYKNGRHIQDELEEITSSADRLFSLDMNFSFQSFHQVFGRFESWRRLFPAPSLTCFKLYNRDC